MIERGIQTYLGFSYSDRLHIATHHHNAPIVERDLMKGVRGRIDVMGEEVLPLREADVARGRRGAARRRRRGDLRLPALLATATPSTRSGSARSSRRPRPARIERRRAGLPVSSELYPLRRDLPRLNSTLIEAYAAEPSRGTLQEVRDGPRTAAPASSCG